MLGCNYPHFDLPLEMLESVKAGHRHKPRIEPQCGLELQVDSNSTYKIAEPQSRSLE